MRPSEIAMAYVKSYYTWRSIIKRCTNRANQDWDRYGGRGIKVDETWLNYDNFFNDTGLPPTQKHSLDRINNDGNYEPGNCRWATNKEQCNNKRNTIWLEHDGRRMPLNTWAEKLGLNESLIYQRLFKLGLEHREDP